jgi:zinc-ribbon domain
LPVQFCRECGSQVPLVARFCFHCGVHLDGASDAALTQSPAEARRRGRGDGILTGVFACLFGILGIFTWGLVFVPLAALCSVIGMLRGLVGRSISGFSISLMGAFLAFVGVVVSPSLWLIVAGFLVASQNHRATATPGAMQPATSAAVTFTDDDDPHTSPEDHNQYYCLSLRLDYPYTRKCPEPWVTVDSADSKGEYNPLISCGSSSPCFPMEESEAARTAAAEANAENIREARAHDPVTPAVHR